MINDKMKEGKKEGAAVLSLTLQIFHVKWTLTPQAERVLLKEAINKERQLVHKKWWKEEEFVSLSFEKQVVESDEEFQHNAPYS